MIWVSDSDWQKLAVVLVNRNIWELIDDEIAEMNGRKEMDDLSWIAKVGNDRNTDSQCFIMNIKVSSLTQSIIVNDMS